MKRKIKRNHPDYYKELIDEETPKKKSLRNAGRTTETAMRPPKKEPRNIRLSKIHKHSK